MENKIIQGDCLGIMKEMEDNSIDAVITDPPYGLSFMGKKWDYDVPSVEIWEECLRVLKPGGYLLAFAGTRTQHRMAVRIEDAGFEIRDMIAWVYGCLSEDTEILTEMGYKPLHKTTQYDRIMVYDIQKNIYQWERPQGWQVYRVYEDTAYRIQSDYTDQIVSRNHNCIVEREGKLVFKKAEELSEVEYMPVLSEDFYTLQKGYGKLLLSKLLRKSKGLAQTLFGKWEREKATRERTGDGKKPSVERWSNLFQKERELRKIQNQVCEVSPGLSADGEERWVCNGTSFDSGSIVGEMFRENPSGASYQSQSRGQQVGKPDIVSIKQGTQDTRVARVTKIKYSGLIFCPTVSTGAFVARRNGKVFITGNSGFPKSRNIGLDVDKMNGVTGNRGKAFVVAGQSGQKDKDTGGDLVPGSNTIGAYKAQNDWSGFGTNLKPALEPITVARKPISEKTVAENCLKWGTGGINIDGSRVGKTGARNNGNSKGTVGSNSIGVYRKAIKQDYNMGRFPANFIHDGSDEVVSLFPNTKGEIGRAGRKSAGNYDATSFKMGVVTETGFKDSGSASRFFMTCKDDPKRAILKVCIKNGNVEIVEKDLATMSLIEQVSSMFSALKNVTQSSDLLNQNLSVLSAEKSVDSTEISFVQNLVAILTGGQMEYTGEMKQTEAWLKSLTQEALLNIIIELNNLAWFAGKQVEELKDTIKTITYLKILYGYVGLATSESTLARFKYQSKASKSERNRGCEGLPLGEPPASARSKPAEGRQNALGEPRANNHPTVKPIALMEYLVKLVSREGAVVLDPFAGSGSTLLACKKLGRNYIGIELDPEYIKIAEARLKDINNTLF